MNDYRRWIYHKELAPNGTIIKSKNEYDKLASEDGWVDTPAKFISEKIEEDCSEINDYAVITESEDERPKRRGRPKKNEV